MKKWSGGMLIVALAIVLFLRYGLIGTQQSQPQKQSVHSKQSAYDFFRTHPTSDSSKEDNETSELKGKKIAKPNKKPRLVDVEGLAYLYGSRNLSDEDSKPFFVWPHLRPLLSRSDALPDTAQGIKEAAIAWKDLLSDIKRERALKSSKSGTAEEKECPYSVSTFDGTLSSSGYTLEFPCGLIEDSSVTVVGMPDGHNGSFQIELVGSKLSGESMPPIVLHYNVSLPGDNMTEQPFIVQNTWTNELGWGKEERCPSHGFASSSKDVTVDGLVICNEQVGRSTMEENQNVSLPSKAMLVNVTHRSAHASANFPFIEGNLFTATLWAGQEGFHMTVNGRHETSFTYREKLEPWSVSGLKVDVGLSLISALAKGLPVSEDHDLVVDIELLKAAKISKKRLVMLVGVFSTGNNFERRMALRRSWMQYEAVRAGEVAVRFFIGLHKNRQVNYELWREAQVYGDIQLMPFVDYYSLISLKTIALCIMGTKILPAKYVMKTDDDAFVRIDEILSSLKDKPSDGLLYGLISLDSSPHRDEESKWYISKKEWPHDAYPPWAHGPGYVISRNIAKFIVRGHQERDLQLFKLEDVAMGIWIEQFKNGGEQVHYISDERFFNAGCESNYVLAHYQGPRTLLCLWEKLQKEHQPICCD